MASLKDLSEKIKSFLNRPLPQQFQAPARTFLNTVNRVEQSPVGIPARIVKGRGEEQARLVKGAVSDFRQNKPVGGLLKSAGAIASVTPPGLGASIFSGGLSALTAPKGNDRAKAFGAGTTYASIGKSVANATNPLISSSLQRYAPGASVVATRGVPAVANVVQGIGMDKAMGQPTTPLSVGVDALAGILGGRGQFRANVPRANFRLDKATYAELMDAETILKDPVKYVNKHFATKSPLEMERMIIRAQDSATETIDRLAAKYLPDKELNKVAGDYKKMVKALVDLHYKNGLADVPGMNLAGETQATKGVAPIKIKPSGTAKPAQAGIKIKSDFEAEMDALAKGSIQDLSYKKPSGGIKLPLDQAAQQRGSTASAIGEFKDRFADWVNQRKSSRLEGLVKSKEFSDLDSLGMRGVFEFQSESKEGRLGDVKKYFDSKYKEVNDSGIALNYKQDYLPQLWNNSREEVEAILGRSLGTRPKFSLESVIKSYEEGIKGGLTPKFTRISDLVGWYESTANKSLADVRYFKELIDDGMVATGKDAPRDWVTINPDKFPKFKVKTDEGSYQGVYKAPPELATYINNYLGEANFKGMEEVANWASTTKNRMLSFGIPMTPINAHGFNILARSFIQSPIKGTAKALKYMVNPGSAEALLKRDLEKAPFAVRSGLTLSSEEYKGIWEGVEKTSKLGKAWNKAFEKPLFDKMLPALKLEKFYDIYGGYKKSMPEKQAAKEAAKFVNTLYGGINWEAMGRSRDLQNFLRASILAPDWAESGIRLGVNTAKSVFQPTSPQARAYQKLLASFLAGYVALNVTNKLTSGKFMFENDPGHQFEIDTGSYTDDGQKRYLRVYGTAADFARVPVDIISGLAKGEPNVAFRAIRNRLSTVAQPLATALTNTDYLGNPVWGKDRYGNPMTLPQNVAGAYTTVAPIFGIPSFMQSGADYLTGKKGGEQALTSALELPVRYKGGSYSALQKQLEQIAPNLSGKERYDLNEQVKGGVKLSDNQFKLASTGGLNEVNKILISRKQKSEENKIREQLQEAGGAKAVGSKVLYFNEATGQTETLNLDFTPPKLKLTGNALLDKKAKSKYQGEITKIENSIVKAVELGYIDATKAEELLVSLGNKKKAVSTAKAKKVSVGAAPKIKISTPKSTYKPVKITEPKIQAAPKIKAQTRPQVKNIRISSGSGGTKSVPAIVVKPFRNTLTGN